LQKQKNSYVDGLGRKVGSRNRSGLSKAADSCRAHGKRDLMAIRHQLLQGNHGESRKGGNPASQEHGVWGERVLHCPFRSGGRRENPGETVEKRSEKGASRIWRKECAVSAPVLCWREWSSRGEGKGQTPEDVKEAGTL